MQLAELVEFSIFIILVLGKDVTYVFQWSCKLICVLTIDTIILYFCILFFFGVWKLLKLKKSTTVICYNCTFCGITSCFLS